MGVSVSLPFTLQNGQTADATQVMANFNSLVTGFLSAAASGANNDITALLALTTPIPYTAGGSSAYIGATSTGTANAQVVGAVTPNGFSLTAGKRVTFIAGATNTGALTLNVSAQGATAVLKPSSAGPLALAGGEVATGNLVEVEFDGTQFQLITSLPLAGGYGTLTNLASATAPDLGSIASHNANITGVTPITGFGSSASTIFPNYRLTFAAALTLTYNGTSLILPGGADIQTAAGDSCTAVYLGSGNWAVVNYTRYADVPGNQVIAGNFRTLVTQATSDTQVAISAAAATLETTGGVAIRLSGISVTATITNSGANGLDTGSEASNTWYATFIIYNPTTQTAAALLSLSATAPTLPAGYTFFVRTGWVRNNASSNLYRTIQQGNKAQYIIGTNPTVTLAVALQNVGTFSVTSPTLASVSLASFVPATASAAVLVSSRSYKSGAAANTVVAPSTAWGGANRGPTGSAGNLYPWWTGSTMDIQTAFEIQLESSLNIGIATTNDSGAGVVILGWTDNL